ncbi:CIC11C00000000552 [Sungouiella intermedia]|uniref:non-specific serine/threonine protein kinase n=1 Tax=Sungouiella intermedia TaxID=45354 RepID=A0A1L0BII3_9ASCO|nr:CIC11C00000000552 [[Candida] intermedia]
MDIPNDRYQQQSHVPVPGQPATPRMLRSVSNSMKNSRTDVGDLKSHGSHSRTPSYTRVPPREKELLPPANFVSKSLHPQPQVPPPNHQHAQLHHQSQPLSQQLGLHHQEGQRSLNHAHPHSQHKLSHSSLQQQQQQQQQFHRKSIGDWDFIRTIGAGSMGKVKLARHNVTNEKCAVKIVPRAAKLYQRAHANDPPLKSAEEAAQRQKEFEKEVARDKRTIREGALGRLLFHPHICRLYEMVPMTNHYYMLFEYVEGGQLLDYIVSHGSLNEKYARKFARGIALALDYCHRNNVVHRDLKIENIMINQKGDIKIIDFGLSNLYMPNHLLKTYCGSLYFAAPELLSAKPYTGPEVDVWSFGVVLYVLVCGKVPFDDPVVSVLHEKIKKGNVEYPSFISKECVSLLSRMLVVDPNRRATLQEVVQHPWMNKGYEFIAPNYMPKRAPLTLPLDSEIIQTIASFDLGLAPMVSEELTNIISSSEYQMSSENWYKANKQGRPYSLLMSLPDPTCSFHPLVSIYYLVDEMRKRKKAKEEAFKAQMRQQVDNAAAVDPNSQKLPAVVSEAPKPNRVPSQSPPKEPFPLIESPKPLVVQQSRPEERKENPFRASQPPKQSLQPTQNIPTLQYPEQAHTSAIPSSLNRKSQSPVAEDGDQIQQQILPQSPSNSVTHETLDPNAGKPLGFNSLLRKLSAKRYKNPGSPTKSATPNRDSFGDDVLSTPKTSFNDSPNKLLPQSSSSSKRDPMVRRGMSMKVTAKEKSSASRVSLEKEQLMKQQRAQPRANEQSSSYKSHARSSSTSGNNKFHGFIPVEYLPPLPNINTSQISGASNSVKAEKAENEAAPVVETKKFHPTARAKSVGGHARKDTAYYRGGNQHPALPNSMVSQNSDEDEDTSQVRKDDVFFDDVTLDDYDHQQLPNLTEEQIVEQFNRARRNSMPSIEYPKTLFLKGFFSVQTTSTKPLPVIRYNIINVLTKLDVKFQEVKGGFVCVHSPSLAVTHSSGEVTPTASTIIDEYRLDDNSEEKRLYGDAFKSSSESLHRTGESNDGKKTPEPEVQAPQVITPQQNSKHFSRQPSLKLNTNVSLGGSNMLSPASAKGHRSSNSMSSSHRRKFSIGQSILHSYRKRNGSQTLMPPNTPAAAKLNKLLLGAGNLDYDDLDEETRAQIEQLADDDSVDSLSGIMVGGGSDMLVSSRIEQKAHHKSASASWEHGNEQESGSTRKTPLKFEINIVKVPLVGLYGVQFKKTLGNTWNYKTLASQILNELNL